MPVGMSKSRNLVTLQEVSRRGLLQCEIKPETGVFPTQALPLLTRSRYRLACATGAVLAAKMRPCPWGPGKRSVSIWIKTDWRRTVRLGMTENALQ